MNTAVVQSRDADLFERRAIAGQERRRRELAEFSSDDLEPIKVVELSRGAFAAMPMARLRASLKRAETVYFLHDEEQFVYAMVLPPALEHLLEIRDVLRDTTKFTSVRQYASEAEMLEHAETIR